MSLDTKDSENIVEIKIEIDNFTNEELDLEVDIKSEPSSSEEEEDVRCTRAAEKLTVKKEPDCTENATHDRKSQDRRCKIANSIVSDAQNTSNVIKVECKEEPTSLLRRRKTKKTYCNDGEESDDIYKPPPVRKKRKYTMNRTSNVKPTYSLKKASKYKFSEDVLSKIEIETITEEQRQLEFDQLAASRAHFKYICALCAQGFAVEEAYLVHKKVHLPEQGPYKCDICHYRHRSEIGLHHHRLRHYRRYRCVTCHAQGQTWQFRDRETAACHVMTEHEKAAWVCHLCNKGFKRPQYLKIHTNQMHTKKDNFPCQFCERVFHEKAVYRSHVRTHNEEVKPIYNGPLRCETCQKDFKTYYSYNKHNMVHEKRKTCNICGDTCKNKDALDRHLRRKHGFTLEETSKGHACPSCPRVLVSNTMLLRHMRRMHTVRSKDFQCDYCKRFYYSKAEVRMHIMWSHLSVAGHACECGRVFRTPSQYRNHAAKEHEGREVPKDHVCELCQKGFQSKQQLTRHMKVHTDQTYSCTECEATFRTRDYVKVHYQLKHLNMTREQIKALKKPKKPKTLDDGFKVQSLKELPKKVIETEQPLYCEVKIEAEEEQDGLHVPLFETFVGVMRK